MLVQRKKRKGAFTIELCIDLKHKYNVNTGNSLLCLLEFFLNGAELSLNSANSGKLINH